jgi:hypothetical protein
LLWNTFLGGSGTTFAGGVAVEDTAAFGVYP